MSRQIRTVRGYLLLEVSSALQKSIRRADAASAGYWAIELFESGFQQYLWRRLLTISAEDCWGVITHEIEALSRSWAVIHKQKPGGGRIFAAKATILLCQARKCREDNRRKRIKFTCPLKVIAALIDALETHQKFGEPLMRRCRIRV